MMVAALCMYTITWGVNQFFTKPYTVAGNMDKKYTPGTRAMILTNFQGAVSIRKTVLPGVAIPMLKIRRPNGRLIFNMEIAIRR